MTPWHLHHVFCLNLNKTKTKIMWIGSQKGNKDKIMGFKCITEPIKALSAVLSYKEHKNDKENFFSKIRKTRTKLNLWQTRDFSLYGRSMLAKAVGISQLIYAASMWTVPEFAIQKTQAELFAFLRRNKKDKIEKQIIYQPISDGGLNFMNFRTMVKSLRLSWIGRLLDGTNANWKAIPNYFFNKYGGLSFLLKCNYDVNLFEANFSLFYRELLWYFQELISIYGGEPMGEIYTLHYITIDQKVLFWKTWLERGIYYVQDFLSEDGKFSSLDECKEKFGLKINYLQYFQITAAIQSSLLQCKPQFLLNAILLYLSEESALSLSKMHCKHYYKLFNECSVSEPTGIKKLKEHFPNSFLTGLETLPGYIRIPKITSCTYQ